MKATIKCRKGRGIGYFSTTGFLECTHTPSNHFEIRMRLGGSGREKMNLIFETIKMYLEDLEYRVDMTDSTIHRPSQNLSVYYSRRNKGKKGYYGGGALSKEEKGEGAKG